MWKYGHYSKWVGNFDLDEFFIIEKHDNIREFLLEYDNDEISHIRMKNNWALLDGLDLVEYKTYFKI